MTQDDKKRQVAEAALEYVKDDMIVGVGTGSTANQFMDALVRLKARIGGTVASSAATAARLRAHAIPVMDLNEVHEVDVYVDGADAATRHKALVKGGGGALTREKIVAAASRRFVCIIDDTKLVDVLGRFPLPVEVIPMARSYVGRQLARTGGMPRLRDGYVTDNGNLILDVHNLTILDPVALETEINQLAGVVGNGLFARRGADVLLIGTDNGVQTIL